MNNSINYSSFIDMVQSSQDEIESDDNNETTDTINYGHHPLQSYLLDTDDADQSCDD